MKYLITFILSINYIFAMGPIDTTVTWVELPDRGNQYKIVEEDMDKTFKDALTEYQKNNDVRKQMIDSIEEAKTSQVDIDRCSISETIKTIENLTLKEDVKLPSGKILVPKGTKVPMKYKEAFNFCIFDGSNDKENELLMNNFSKNCVFMVNKRNIDDLSKKYEAKFYPFDYFFKEKLDLKCLPVEINFKNEERNYHYINIKDLKDEKVSF